MRDPKAKTLVNTVLVQEMQERKRYPGSTACPDCRLCPDCGQIVHDKKPSMHKSGGKCGERAPMYDAGASEMRELCAQCLDEKIRRICLDEKIRRI